MPTQLSPPVYAASRAGLVANWTANFSGDNIVNVPLNGSFQGDGVLGVSLFIDNYNNGTPLQYNIGGDVEYIAAYTNAFIDVTGCTNILLTAPQNMSVPLALYNMPRSGGASRGQPPAGISDPMFSSVAGLWHFDGNNGTTIGVDSRNAGLYFASNGGQALLNTAQSKFGGASAFIPGNVEYTEIFSPKPIPYVPYTWEFSCLVDTFNAGSNTMLELTESIASQYDSAIIVAYNYDSVTTKMLRFELWRLQFRNTPNPTAGLLCATAYQYDANAEFGWHDIAITSIGGFTMYVDGVEAATGSTAVALAGSVDMGMGVAQITPVNTQKFYIDEMRLTMGTRYTANYAVAGQEFPNQ